MATLVLKNVKTYVDGYDLSGFNNQGTLTFARPPVETTKFGVDSRTYLPGLMEASYSLAGFTESDGTAGQDDIYGDTTVVTATKPVSLVPAGATENNVAYSFDGLQSDYQIGGSVGDAYEFTVSGSGTGTAVRGLLMEPGTSARSSSSNSTGSQLGALVAGDTLVAALHVVDTTSSPTLDVDIERDDNSGFTTSAVHASFTQATAVGSEVITNTTAHADDWWRVAWTFGGSGDITFVVVLGINGA